MHKFVLIACYSSGRTYSYGIIESEHGKRKTGHGYESLDTFAKEIRTVMNGVSKGVPVAPINMVPEGEKDCERLSPADEKGLMNLLYE